MAGLNKLNFNHEEIIRLFKAGYTIEEISQMLPFSYGQVQTFLKYHNLIKPQKRRHVHPEIVIDVYKTNHSIEETVKLTGIHVNIVYGILKRSGLVKSKYKFRGNEYNTQAELTIAKEKFSSEIREFILKGYTKEQLMEKFKISKASAAKYMTLHSK